MVNADAQAVQARIASDCSAAIGTLDARRGKWLQLHTIPPRPIMLSRKTDGSDGKEYWLVTDHKGSDDASFRVVFDDEVSRYGIECAILNSISLFIGYRATLAEAVSDIIFVR